MTIKYLELKDYNRFNLANIKHLIYQPQDRIQIFIGKNGSGKSSLLYELSPLPANLTKDYGKEGMKYIIIEKDGKTYHLKSQDGKHSFIVDDVELNDGGTRKVQLQLVEDYFYITPMIHDVLIGKKRLSTMSVHERKQWLSYISKLDYDYALQVYKNLQSKHKELKILIKDKSQRLSELLKLDVDPDLLHTMHRLKEQLLSTVDIINRQIQDHEDPADIISRITQELDQARNSIEQRASITHTHIPEDELQKQHARLTYQLRAIRDQLEINYNYRDQVDKLTTRIQDIMDAIDRLTPLTYPIEGYHRYREDLSNLLKVRSQIDRLLELRATLPHYEDLDQAQQHLSEHLASIEQDLSRYQKRVDQLQLELQHIQKHQDDPDIVCPQCHHAIQLYDPQQLQDIKTQIDDLYSKIDNIYKNKTTIEAEYQQLSSYLSYLDELRQHIYRYLDPLLADHLYHLVISDEHYRLDDFYKDFQDEVQRLILLDQLASTQQELDTLQNGHQLLSPDKLQELEETYDLLDKKHQLISQELAHIDLLRDIRARSTQLYHQLQQDEQLLRRSIRHQHYQRSAIQYTTQLRSIIADLDHKIIDLTYSSKSISTLQSDIEMLETQLDKVSTLLDTLSPTHGIIARSIVSFLDNFTSDINSIVNHIWSYPMEMLPYNLDRDQLDLTFRFPIAVHSQLISTDISQVSSGMQEILDLAFRIVSMAVLGISHYPLYLDEYATHMDPHHRDQAYHAIQRFLDESQRQVFIVSHFTGFISKFPTADVISLVSDELSDIDIPHLNDTVTIR